MVLYEMQDELKKKLNCEDRVPLALDRLTDDKLGLAQTVSNNIIEFPGAKEQIISRFNIGDSVKVKKGVIDPDYKDYCIEDWQGRIFEISPNNDDDGVVVGISIDSQTMNGIDHEVLIKSVNDAMDTTNLFLLEEDVETAKERDTIEDVAFWKENLVKKIQLIELGKAGERIHMVLQGIQPADFNAAFDRWNSYLNKKLTFPFRAWIKSNSSFEHVDVREAVDVVEIDDLFKEYGITIKVELNKEPFMVPLCDVEVDNKRSLNYRIVKDYSQWYLIVRA